MPASFLKDPDAVLDYGVDWSAWLAGDAIASWTWTIARSGSPTPAATAETPDLREVPGRPSVSDGKVVRVWVEAGVPGADYEATCRVVTVGGRADDRTVRFMVRHS